MEEIDKYRIVNKLKGIYRINSQDTRKESSAEHSWGCLILAEFLLPKVDQSINKTRVFELLMYHDLVEIHAGDTPIHPDSVKKEQRQKEEEELAAAKRLRSELPKGLGEKFWSAFEEFEARATPEAKFAKAVDAMEAIIHEFDYKEDWKGFSEAYLRKKKQPFFEPFPKLQALFEEMVQYMNQEGYFNQ